MKTNPKALQHGIGDLARRSVASSAIGAAIAALAACGGGGDGDGSDPHAAEGPITSAPSTGPGLARSATIVVPASIRAAAVALHEPAGLAPKSATCPSVPEGYDPAAGARVEFVAASGLTVAEGATDACGSLPTPGVQAAVAVRVTPIGHQTLTVATHRAVAGTVASALPVGAKLEIAALQASTSRSLTALVVDSVTKKAVLGLAPEVFSATAGGMSLGIARVSDQNVGAITEPYSTVLVMDGSGSMSMCAANCPGDPGHERSRPSFNRLQLAARAAHRFLDGKKSADEVAMVVFDNQADWLSDAFFANRFRNAAGATVGHAFSPDGFTQDAGGLRLVVDYYNDHSAFWRTGGDALHPITAGSGLRPIAANPWSGSTALFTAAKLGIDRVAVRPFARKIVIAMTDGQNNAGRETLASATAAARGAGVPVYTIGFGLDPNSSSERAAIGELQRLAADTGADSTVVNGTDIVGLFAGLQTAIRFQTTLSLSSPLVAGQQVSLLLMTEGQPTVSRTVTVPAGLTASGVPQGR